MIFSSGIHCERRNICLHTDISKKNIQKHLKSFLQCIEPTGSELKWIPGCILFSSRTYCGTALTNKIIIKRYENKKRVHMHVLLWKNSFERIEPVCDESRVRRERANIIVLPSDFYAIVGCRDTCTPPHIEGHCAARANTLSHQPTSPPGHNMRIWRAVTLGTPREHFPLGPEPGRTRHWAFVYFWVRQHVRNALVYIITLVICRWVASILHIYTAWNKFSRPSLYM